LAGQDYLDRLNSPTPWTRRIMPAFRKTTRALTCIRASFGRGPGGVLATLRFSAGAGGEDATVRAVARDLLPKVAVLPQITGAHLCLTDQAASAILTRESRERADSQPTPNSVMLIEGCNLAPIEHAVGATLDWPEFATNGPTLGIYRLEHVRLKTATVAG
jgi:hypothetical protein